MNINPKLLPIQERIEEFHSKHPDVYAQVVRYARIVKNAGFKKIGIATFSRRRS